MTLREETERILERLREQRRPRRKVPEYASVDVGIVGTGMAFWELVHWGQLVNPTDCFNVAPPRKLTEWSDRVDFLAEAFSDCLNCRNVKRVYFEMPEFFGGSAKGWTAAARGDLLKLTFLLGSYARVCAEAGIPYELIDVTVWKGQLPKRVVIQRIKRRLPSLEELLKPTTHSWDAIGIGLHAKGYMTV